MKDQNIAAKGKQQSADHCQPGQQQSNPTSERMDGSL
jgi:hypothetical protein